MFTGFAVYPHGMLKKMNPGLPFPFDLMEQIPLRRSPRGASAGPAVPVYLTLPKFSSTCSKPHTF